MVIKLKKKNKEIGNEHYKTAKKKKLLQLVCTLHANEQD